MSAKDELTLEISWLKALLYSLPFTASLWGVGALLVVWDGVPVGAPFHLISFVILVGIGTPVFTAILVLQTSCSVASGGIRNLFFGEMGWEEMETVRSNPLEHCYWIRGRGLFSKFCMVPRPFLLKRPDQLWKAIDLYAPSNHFIRSRLKG